MTNIRNGFLIAAATFSLISPAQAADGLCGRIAETLQIGKPAPHSLLDGLSAVVPAEEGRDVSATLEGLHPDKGLLDSARELESGYTETPSVYWLGDANIGAIEIVAGTAHCQTLRFFTVRDGHAVSVPGPDAIKTNEACWTDNVSFGTIAGTPYAVELDDALGDRVRSMTASRWDGDRWEPTCRLVETHSVTLRVKNGYCEVDATCQQLEPDALQRASKVQAGREQLTRAIAKASTVDTARAKKMTLPTWLPTFDKPSDPYTEFDDQEKFAVDYVGQPIVGAIGAGRFGWREYDGWLVGYWTVKDGGYKPLAGFQVARQLGDVLSISVDYPR